MAFDSPEPELQYQQEIIIVEREPPMLMKGLKKGISHGYDTEGNELEFIQKAKQVNNLLYP